MYFKPILKPLAACLSVIAANVYAAQPVNMRHMPVNTLKASSFELKQISQITDAHRVTHTRMQQQYHGYDVVGGTVISHKKQSTALQSSNSLPRMNGFLFQGLAQELGSPANDLEQQSQAALDDFLAQYQGAIIKHADVKPVVYVDNNNRAHWAYHVSANVQQAHSMPKKPNAFLDAKTHQVFIAWDEIKTASHAKPVVKGKGFGGNNKLGKLSFDGQSLPLLEVGRDRRKQTCFMENKEVKVVHMEHSWDDSITQPMKFNCLTKNRTKNNAWWTGFEGDGLDSENGAYSISNDALYDGFVIKRMYREWYDQDPLAAADGNPMQLVMRVHFGEGYENAFWDGQQMTFGDGARMFYPLVSLGVGAHEVSHGFTEQHSNLSYRRQSGGMNESFSDMSAQAAEFYAFGKSSWMIGAEIVKESSGYEALRFMETPSRDGSSIDTADEYYDGLDVHYSSGVYNRMFYLLANSEGWDTKKAFDVMVLANMGFWTSDSTFEEGACGILNAAEELNDSVQDDPDQEKKTYPLTDIIAAMKKVKIYNAEACVIEPDSHS